ncbi:MAG: EAL domain-containing protein [Actinomycetota bacterium]
MSPAVPDTGAALVAIGTDLGHSAAVIGTALDDAGAEPSRRGTVFVIPARHWGAAATSIAERLTAPEQRRVRVAWLDDDDLAASLLLARPFDEANARHSGSALHDLIRRRAFRCAYQPIVELGTGEPIGHEALLRVAADEGDWTAGELFDTAASAGWTDALDRIGREQAIEGAGAWIGDLRLFVNFIPTSVYRPEHCLTTTWRAAERAGLDPYQITFEVTEGTDVDPHHLDHVLDVYRAAGCQIAVDDVGAGYGSLSRVARLRPDVVKLDLALVQQLPAAAPTAVTRSIVGLADDIGATVLAEGIETEEQRRHCLDLGITLGQGWLFGRPEFADPLRFTA